ncbi:unnamed protein product [Brassica rapa subsp. narinosa]
MELLEDGMSLSSWFQLGSSVVLLVGRFSTQISSCSRLAACGPSEAALVAARGDVLTQPCVRGVLRVCSLQSFYGLHCRCRSLLSVVAQISLAFVEAMKFDWLETCLQFRLLSHSVKLLWRWGLCLEAAISKSQTERRHRRMVSLSRAARVC